MPKYLSILMSDETDLNRLLGLTCKLANYYARDGGDRDEYFSAGLVGIAYALRTYRPQHPRAVALGSWGWSCITSFMQEYARQERRTRRLRPQPAQNSEPSLPFDGWEVYYRHLTPRQRLVFQCHLQGGLSFARIGARLGMTSEGARRIYLKGLRHLRHVFHAEEGLP